MATVYLPFGYPLISGAAFQTLIYQGGVVRLYTVPSDPRTNSQTFQRKQFSDISKMRSTLGLWGRNVARLVLGPRWSSVLLQLVKADDGGIWSSAAADWADGSEAQRDAWRAAAPYQATFNDPGQMFFYLARALLDNVYAFSGEYWSGASWSMAQSADCATWWGKTLAGILTEGKTQETGSYVEYTGDTEVRAFGSADGGNVMSVWGDGTQKVRVLWVGRSGTLRMVKADDYHTVDVFLDGALVGTYDLLQWVGDAAVFVSLSTTVRGLHYLELKPHPGNVVFNFDSLEVT